MKMEGLTTFMKDQPKIKSVYLLNQNYSHGQQVAKYFKDAIARKRPDVQDRRRGPAPDRARSRTSRPTSPRSSSPAPTPSSPATGART
jgi:ABC-type branched-subunit amino acid transport system substrate-binding protein